MASRAGCPACSEPALRIFHEESGVPVHSCLLVETREAAEAFPRGEIRLGFCERCGFISNTAYQVEAQNYAGRYEETQSISPLFREFAQGLAARWVEQHELRDKHVLEIGCGKGDFLVWMCEAGAGGGTGIDPSLMEDRVRATSAAAERIEWIADFFDERYLQLSADAIVCRHTLEHIDAVADFVRLVRRSLDEGSETVVLFDIPDTLRVLDEVAFWDVYYEHCSYFTPGSLARLFRRNGFEVLDLELAYGGQMILLEARAAHDGEGSEGGAGRAAHPLEEDIETLSAAVDRFAAGYSRKLAEMRAQLEEARAGGGSAVIWGAGSKGVAYLGALGIRDEIEYAVDINPYKHGMFMAGTGQQIVAPKFLAGYRPDTVIAMNPLYRDEIQRELDRLGVDARLLTI